MNITTAEINEMRSELELEWEMEMAHIELIHELHGREGVEAYLAGEASFGSAGELLEPEDIEAMLYMAPADLDIPF